MWKVKVKLGKPVTVLCGGPYTCRSPLSRLPISLWRGGGYRGLQSDVNLICDRRGWVIIAVYLQWGSFLEGNFTYNLECSKSHLAAFFHQAISPNDKLCIFTHSVTAAVKLSSDSLRRSSDLFICHIWGAKLKSEDDCRIESCVRVDFQIICHKSQRSAPKWSPANDWEHAWIPAEQSCVDNHNSVKIPLIFYCVTLNKWLF